MGLINNSFVQTLDLVLNNAIGKRYVTEDEIICLLDNVPISCMTTEFRVWLRDVKKTCSSRSVDAESFVQRVNTELRAKLEDIDRYTPGSPSFAGYRSDDR